MRTWWEKSASIIITKSPVQKLRPCTYAVLWSVIVKSQNNNSQTLYPRPSFPGRGFRTCGWVEVSSLPGHCTTHNFVLSVNSCELVSYFLGTIWACIVNNNDFPCKFAVAL